MCVIDCEFLCAFFGRWERFPLIYDLCVCLSERMLGLLIIFTTLLLVYHFAIHRKILANLFVIHKEKTHIRLEFPKRTPFESIHIFQAYPLLCH